MKRGLLVLVFLAACTNSNSPTDSTISATTSSTTASTPVATTVAPTTVPLSTTTITGTDAAFPFIVSQAGLIGYYDGEHWVTSELESPVTGGEIYRVIDLAGEVGTSVGSEIMICEPAGTPLIELDPPLAVTNDEPSEIAITGATWGLLPRPVEQPDTPPTDLVGNAVSFIEDRGLSDPDPQVSQYLRFDLEGDGTDEDVVVMSRLPEDLFGSAASYSLVMMRKQLDVEPAYLIVAYSQGVDDNAYVVSYFVSAVADLNGDDRMELVVDGHYYEGNFTSVYEYIDDDLGLLEVIVSGCGA